MITLDPTAVCVILDSYILERLTTLERRIRADMQATGPEDEPDLDAPPDPEASDWSWSRISVEEIVLLERARLEYLRDRLLACDG